MLLPTLLPPALLTNPLSPLGSFTIVLAAIFYTVSDVHAHGITCIQHGIRCPSSPPEYASAPATGSEQWPPAGEARR